METQAIRRKRGYVYVFDICDDAYRIFQEYLADQNVQIFMKALIKDLGSEQIIEKNLVTGGPSERGIWIHPRLAIHFMCYISPDYCLSVVKWVEKFQPIADEISFHRIEINPEPIDEQCVVL